MNLNSMQKLSGERRMRKRVGRGRASGMGKTCSRGTKGQMSRKGHKHKLGFEGGQMRLIRRLPKRGFKNARRVDMAWVNVGDLSCFPSGSEVNEVLLREKGLVRGPVSGIKILGRGELAVKLTVKANAFSASACEKIKKADGQCEVVAI